MHYKETKSILSPNNGMNLYRGCTHGCIYCDSRSTCYQINHPFEDVEVKINAPEILEQTLRIKRKKCMIGTGSMTDPYCHIETKERLTRKCLQIIDKYGFGVSIQTKSTRLLEDLDLLKSINKKSKVVVNVTMTTYNEKLCKILEPNVSTTKERFEMLKILNENGIKTIVWLSPILPFINDTEHNIKGILDYCIEAKVYGIICFGMGVTLREGDREFFYQKLDENFPGLKDKYIKYYGNKYEVNSFKNVELLKLFNDICKQNNIITDVNYLFNYMHTYEDKQEQLSLF